MGDSTNHKTQFNADFLDRLLAEPESEVLDFKRMAGKTDSVIKTACAMSNGLGGIICLGVEDPGKGVGPDRLYGIDENPEALGNIKRDLVSRIVPSLEEPATLAPSVTELPCRLRDGNAGTIVLLAIHPGGAVHSIRDGGTYRRFGCQNRQLSASEITRLSLGRGVTSDTDTPVDIPIELLDTTVWQDYARHRGLSRPMAEQLRHLGLSRMDSNGRWLTTRAAVLLFAENPGGLLCRKCAIRIFHYQGHQIDYAPDTNLAGPPTTVNGPILNQIRAATDFVSGILRLGVQVTRRGFEIRQHYPIRVIQEAITNAAIHRDYSLDRDIQIRIFANRIEIESPGGFPGQVTLTNLRAIGSRPRNRTLVDHLREFPEPPNLDAGEGVRMMFSVLERDGLYPPVYRTEAELHEDVIRVDLRNELRESEWGMVQDYLREHGLIGNADVRRIVNSPDTAKISKLLREWVDAGLLAIANPARGKRSRVYRLASGNLNPVESQSPIMVALRAMMDDEFSRSE